MRVVVAVPALNPGRHAAALAEALHRQTLQPERYVILDSESDDGSLAAFVPLAPTVVRVRRADFDHGGTRNLVLRRWEADVYIFMTQDAVPTAADSLERLVEAFGDPTVGMAYGRQLARPGETAMGRHAREFNYPPASRTVRAADIPRLGIKAAFCSNSFAAYRGRSLRDVGLFPERVVLGEDTLAAARMLGRGWGIAYVAEATATHSHGYTALQDFRRYFDTGALHSAEAWFIERLGQAGGEGVRFVRSEWRYMLRAGEPFPRSRVIFRNAARWVGYQLGRRASVLPRWIVRRCAMHRAWFERIHAADPAMAGAD